MQLLQEQPLAQTKDNTMMMTVKPSAETLEVKEKISSNGSLMPMVPVASGDNVATRLNSSQKVKEDLPPLVPCCEGRELSICEDLVKTGLSAISMRHDTGVIQSLSMSHAMERLQFPPGLIKHRNSFRCLHRPDLKRVPYLRRMTAEDLETLFRGYSGPGRTAVKIDKEKDENVRALSPADEKVQSRDIESPAPMQSEVNNLNPIPETRSGSEDVPAGMRLHGARARLYTSVLAGVKTGDHNESTTSLTNDEDYDVHVPEVPAEDDVILIEELQIILPPRCDDVTADSSVTSSNTTR